MNQTQLYPGVWRLIAPNPSLMTGPGTNTYLVGHTQGQVIIVDSGPATPSHLEAIVTALQTLNATAQAIVLTHHHSDHAGGAEDLARQLNIPILSFGAPLQPGDEIKLDQPSFHPFDYAQDKPSALNPPPPPPELTLVVHHTPGHIQAHLCLWLVEQRLLFAGDLVAGQGTILIIPPDGDMAAYLDSLRAMLALAPAAILPGHGPVIKDAPALLQQYLAHRLRREQQVLELLDQGYTTAAAIAAQIYAGQPEVLDIATLQVEAHLAKLRREGRVQEPTLF